MLTTKEEEKIKSKARRDRKGISEKKKKAMLELDELRAKRWEGAWEETLAKTTKKKETIVLPNWSSKEKFIIPNNTAEDILSKETTEKYTTIMEKLALLED